MRIPRDAGFYSSVLFTIAFACLVPSQFINAMAGHPNKQLELGPAWGAVASLNHQLGIASLAIIFIGLIVTWTGYVNKIRWTWFVLFIIVWGWAFPLMIWPLFGTLSVPVHERFLEALKRPGISRDLLEEILIFSLLLIALFLPIKSFAFPDRKLDTNNFF